MNRLAALTGVGREPFTLDNSKRMFFVKPTIAATPASDREGIPVFPFPVFLFLKLIGVFFFLFAAQQRASAQCTVNISNNVIELKPAGCVGSEGYLQGSTPVGGNGTYTYQWEHNTGDCGDGGFTPINGATSKDFSIPASAAAGTCYRRIVRSGGCSSESNKVKVDAGDQTTPVAPTVSVVQPTCTIATGSITVTSPLPAPGQTYSVDGTTYTNTSGVFAGLNPGTYSVTVKYSAGCVSPARTVTVNALPLPTGTISPASATICTGGSQVLTANGGIQYQWFRNGSAISGAIASTYTATQAGTYTVNIINGSCSGPASNSAVITQTQAPTGSINPSTATICAGNTVALTISGGTSYQWYRNGTLISGATAATYNAAQSGTYTVDIIGTAGCNGQSANSAVVTVNNLPSGTITPASVTICPGGSATLTATGGTSYQWFKDNVLITGATTATLNATAAGTYSVDIFQNNCKAKASNNAVVSLGSSPSGSINPTSGVVCNNNPVVLTVGGGTSYQWYRNNVLITGATTATYAASQAGTYTAEIFSGTCSGKATNSVAITTGNTPSGSISPSSAAICPGGSQTLTATGGGTYQWFKDGVAITGATASTYSVNQAGTYSVTISNGGCSAPATNSSVITLAGTPSGTISPSLASICAGTSQVLTATGGTSYQWFKDNVIISGATAATYNATQSGTYTVDIVNSSGCKAKASNSATVNVAPVPTGSISPATASICAGSSVTLSAGGGNTYQWYKDNVSISGATASALTTSDPGVYTVDIEDNGGCKAKASNQSVVTVNNIPTGSISPAAVTICPGGAATLTASGGTSYQWYKNGALIAGAVNTTYTVTEAATYSVDIIGNGGCRGPAANTSVVSIGAAPSGSITPTTGVVCGNTGSVLLTVGGGTSYQWYRNGTLISGATAATYLATTPGSYTAAIISGTCTGLSTNAASITQSSLPSGGISPATAGICAGGTITLSTSGGTSYQWLKDGVPITGANAATLQVTTAGVYAVTITNGLCSAQATNVATITPVAGPTGSVSPSTASVCVGSSVTLTATGGSTYQWYKDNVAIGGATAATYSASQSGTYTVEVTNSIGCKAMSANSAVVTVSPLPTGTISPATGFVCGNNTITLTATGGTSYQWYRNGVAISGATASTYIAAQAGTYTTDVVLGNCKGTASNSAVITLGTVPTGTISPAAASICTGNSVTLSVSGGTSYQWLFNGNPIQGATSATYTATQTGTYGVTIFNATCSGPASNTAVITQSTPITFGFTTVDATCTIPTGTITVSTPTGGSGSGYQYSRDNGATFQTSNVFANVPVGSYQVVVKDAAGCFSNPAAVTVKPSTSTLAATVAATSITCTQTTGSATVTATGGVPPYTYQFDGGATQTGNSSSTLAVGTHKVLVKDAAGCLVEVSFSITQVNSTLGATATVTGTTCGLSNGSVTVNATGGTPDYTYSLNNGAYQAANTFANLATGQHKVTVKDKAGCLFTVVFDIKAVSVTPNLLITNPAQLCPGTTANLQAAAVTAGSDTGLVYTYWRDAAATTALANPAAVTAGVYYVKATNRSGCSTVKPVDVVLHTTVAGTITALRTNACNGDSIVLTASNGRAYQWFRNDTLIAGATRGTYTVKVDGVYGVAIDDGTCTTRASNTLRIQFQDCIALPDTKVFVPTAFTPNKNGTNDVLRPILYNVAELQYFKVFNRWGQQVFQTSVMGKGWDGTLNGQPQPSETYSWILQCTGKNGETIKQSGRSLLIR